MIPSVQECFHLMDKYAMLANIRAHTVEVGKIAFLIARGLYRSGIDISVKKATVGALLHDIGKTPSLKSGENHAETGMRICLDNDIGQARVRIADRRDAEAGSHDDLLAIADQRRRRHTHAQFVSNSRRLRDFGSRQHQDELLAANSGDDIASTTILLQQIGEVLQCLVTDAMAELVVDGLKVINIRGDD